MNKPHVLIMSGYGLNCEDETAHAFRLAGARADIVHINKLIENPKQFLNYQIMAFPGGFAYGDDTGAGNAYANKLKNNVWNHVHKFVEDKKLVIGICNGFQIAVNLGLLPAIDGKFGTRQAALLTNQGARYLNRWVDLRITNNSIWLKDIATLSCPIAHGEGRFYAEESVLHELKKNNQIAAVYSSLNPNGSLMDIAAISDKSGRVLGMMPHPERGMFFTQRPDWPLLKEKLQREGKELPEFSDGIKVFQNAVYYFS